jgi:uncharacterized membrane protein YgdD (TMEM256/DUF423 family)
MRALTSAAHVTFTATAARLPVLGSRAPARKEALTQMPMNGQNWFARLTIFVAGILGAAGVASAAGAAHTGDPQILGALALVAMTQAPALLALGLHAGRSLTRIAVGLIGLGALLFSADLAAVHFLGASPMRFLAPVGGTLLIAGWIVIAVCALIPRRS